MRFEFWQSKRDRQWYARIRAGNGRATWSNGQGYTRRSDVLRAIDRAQAKRLPAGVLRVVEVFE